MSQRELIIDGVHYVRSRDAARATYHAPDYVSRLARSNLIDGRQVGGLWWVNLNSLRHYITEQERQRAIWRADLSRQRREEQRLAGHPSAIAALT